MFWILGGVAIFSLSLLLCRWWIDETDWDEDFGEVERFSTWQKELR